MTTSSCSLLHLLLRGGNDLCVNSTLRGRLCCSSGMSASIAISFFSSFRVGNSGGSGCWSSSIDQNGIMAIA